MKWLSLEFPENIETLKMSNILTTHPGYSLPTRFLYRVKQSGLIVSHPTLLLVENDQIIAPSWSAALEVLWKADRIAASQFTPFTSYANQALILADYGARRGLWKVHQGN